MGSFVQHILDGRRTQAQHIKIDSRSLNVFRTLLALYILWDVVGRLSLGHASLAWYTSPGRTNRYPSIQHPKDTPHGSKLHQIWFYRGSELFQTLCFLLQVLFAVAFALGLGWESRIKSLFSFFLWLSTVAIQNRCTQINDGSDRFLRCLLVWCIFLPSIKSSSDRQSKSFHRDMTLQQSKKFDFDNHGHGLKSHPSTDADTDTTAIDQTFDSKDVVSKRSTIYEDETVSSVATTGLLLQIVLMYLGTVLNRMKDDGIGTWFPPSLEAVYYATSSTFATRYWSTTFLRSHINLTKLMTFQAMIIEGLCPIACLLVPYPKRYIPAVMIASLHFGLLISMKLPQWQVLGIICSIVWFPSSVWDVLEQQKLFQSLKTRMCLPLLDSIRQMFTKLNIIRRIPIPLAEKVGEWITNKKNRITSSNTEELLTKETKKTKLSGIVAWFLLVYMIYNFLGEHGYIRKHDHGDIGEAVQLSQKWVMYGPDPPTTCLSIVIYGNVRVDGITDHHYPIHIDVLSTLSSSDNDVKFITRGELDEMLDGPSLAVSTYVNHMSLKFPTWRWENVINKWYKQNERVTDSSVVNLRSRLSRLNDFLCVYINEIMVTRASRVYKDSLKEVHIHIKQFQINKPNDPKRFTYVPGRDINARKTCLLPSKH